jgi:hypothetical protein
MMDLLPDLTRASDELAIPPNASPVDFLRAVYCSPTEPMHRRLRAAIECAPYVHPKLAVTASIDGKSFAVALEAAIARSGKATVIEHQADQADFQKVD